MDFFRFWVSVKDDVLPCIPGGQPKSLQSPIGMRQDRLLKASGHDCPKDPSTQ